MNAFETLLSQIFLGSALLIVGLEQVHALRRSPRPAFGRWAPNLGLYLFSGVVSRLLMPVSVIGLAWNASGPGVLARLGLPPLLEGVAGFLILDLTMYVQHRVLHMQSWLWRMHLVHHTDTQVDITTTERHHPFEVLLGTAVMATVVAGLGLPALAVGSFAVLSAVTTLWSHANIRLPVRLERWLNMLFATPGSHVIHHSSHQPETDSNFGTVLTVWDRLFGTFRPAQPAPPRQLGLEYLRRPQESTFFGLLKQPFASLRPLTAQEAAAQEALEAASPAADRMPMSAAWRSALCAIAIGLMLSLVVVVPTMSSLAGLWQMEAYRHGWLVLPMLVYVLAWAWRDEVLALAPAPSWTGAAVAAAAGLAWVLASLLNIELGRQVALVLALQGLLLAALGWTTYRRMFPALALLALAVPVGDVLQPFLRWLTLKGLETFITVAGWPMRVDGFLLTMDNNHRYFVADECSGLAHVTLMFFLGYCFGLLMFRSMWRVLSLAAVGALLGVLSNQFRVMGIVLVDQLTGSQMDLQSHGVAQWIALALMMVSLLLVLSRLEPETLAAGGQAAAAPRAPGGPWSPAVLAAPLAGLALLLSGAAVAWLERAGDQPAPLLQANAVPRTVNGWTMPPEQAPVPVAGRAAPAANAVAATAWSYRQAERTLDATLFQPLSSKVKLSDHLATPTDRPWRDIRRERITACAGMDCREFMHVVWRVHRDTPLRHVYLQHATGGQHTVSPVKLRWAAALDRVRGRPNSTRLLALASSGAEIAPTDLVAMSRAADAAFPQP